MRAVTFDAEQFLDGSRSALLAVTLPVDRYREHEGGAWRVQEDGFEHGKCVHTVDHFGHYVSTVGGMASIRSMRTGQRYPLQITGIRMVEVPRLSGDDIHDLGYASRDAWMMAWGKLLRRRTAWLIRAILIDSSGRAL